MNVLGSLSVPWLFAIGSIRLHLEDNLAMSPLLLKYGSLTSILITTLCFFTVSSEMNYMRLVTVSD